MGGKSPQMMAAAGSEPARKLDLLRPSPSDAPAPSAKSPALSGHADRHLMVMLCALCTFINYADRVNMSVAIIYIAQTYSFTLSQQSAILSTFFLGYIPMQLGGALLSRRLGAKAVLLVGSFLWSLFTLLTPFSADHGLSSLLLCRLFMGLAEGVAFPAVYHFLSCWIPVHERGRATAFFLTGAHVGTTVALILSPLIVDALHWRYIFYIFSLLGFAWIPAWHLLAYENHHPNPHSSQEPVPHLVNVVSSDQPSAETPKTLTSALAPPSLLLTRDETRMVRVILTDRRTLTVCAAQSLFAMIHYVILSWLPTYFKAVFQLDTKSLSFTFIPYAAMAVAANLGGAAADLMIQRGYSVTIARKTVTAVSALGAAVCLIIFTQMRDAMSAVVAASFSMAFMSGHSGGFESAYLDLASPGAVGLFKATSNTLGSIGGFVAVPLSTWMLQFFGGSWPLMFASLSLWHAAMAGVFCAYYSAERSVVTEGGR